MIAKQMEVRSNIKKYFDMAHEGEIIIIPRKENKNVVIISEAEYDRLKQFDRIKAYAGKAPVTGVSKKKKSAVSSDMVRKHNIKKMDEISSFGDNWNGNGAPSFPKPLIRKVKDLLTALEIQPEVFPTALCTIQLEYDNSRKDHMEIEIDMSDSAEVFTVAFNGEESFEEISTDAEAINERVRDFYG